MQKLPDDNTYVLSEVMRRMNAERPRAVNVVAGPPKDDSLDFRGKELADRTVGTGNGGLRQPELPDTY